MSSTGGASDDQACPRQRHAVRPDASASFVTPDLDGGQDEDHVARPRRTVRERVERQRQRRLAAREAVHQHPLARGEGIWGGHQVYSTT